MTNSYYKEMIRLADSIADKAHEGQTDRNGWPYISHPRRVALGARKLVSDGILDLSRHFPGGAEG